MIAAAAIETADPAPTSGNPALAFLDALCRRDFEEIESVLAPNVWFRALLPKKRYEHHHAEETLESLRSWYANASELRVLKTDHHEISTRTFISYRFLVLPDWAPEEWHVIEQVGFLRVRDGKVSRIDLVCTGFFPADELDIEGLTSIRK